MTQRRSLSETIRFLDQLSRSSDVPGRYQDTAVRLQARLNAPVRVGVFGATSDHEDALFNGLLSGVGGASIATSKVSIQVGDLAIKKRGKIAASDPFANTDIAIWATTNFAAQEAEIWSATSDRLKDHSFLVPLYDRNVTAPDANCVWVDAALDDFAGFMALPLHDNIVLTAPLLAALRDRAKRGKQADQDSAEMLIEMFHNKITVTPTIAPAVAPAPPVGTMRTDIWQRASEALKATGKELSALPLNSGVPNHSDVLAICVTASETLSDMFLSASGDNQYQQSFKNDVLTAADNIVLMSFEDDTASAIDATMTLLQLQKDIQLQLYRS